LDQLGPQELQGEQEQLDNQVHLDNLDLRELRVIEDHRDHKGQLDHKDLLGQLDNKDNEDPKVQPDNQGH
jgi:hypothetical protein